jgi:hypothetical protein
MRDIRHLQTLLRREVEQSDYVSRWALFDCNESVTLKRDHTRFAAETQW